MRTNQTHSLLLSRFGSCEAKAVRGVVLSGDLICYKSSLRRIQVSGSEAGDEMAEIRSVFVAVGVGVLVMNVQSSAGSNECGEDKGASSKEICEITGDPCAEEKDDVGNAGADVVGNDSGVVMMGDGRC